MIDLKEFGLRIKKRRLELHMSQEDLAKRSGYTSRSSINKIELGFVDVPQSKIVTIANALDVSPTYLVGWGDAPLPVDMNIHSSSDMLSAEKTELLRIYDSLNIKNRTALMTFAFHLEEENNEPTVRIYRAARSTNDAPATIEERPIADMERLRKAKKVTREEDL